MAWWEVGQRSPTNRIKRHSGAVAGLVTFRIELDWRRAEWNDSYSQSISVTIASETVWKLTNLSWCLAHCSTTRKDLLEVKRPAVEPHGSRKKAQNEETLLWKHFFFEETIFVSEKQNKLIFFCFRLERYLRAQTCMEHRSGSILRTSPKVSSSSAPSNTRSCGERSIE